LLLTPHIFFLSCYAILHTLPSFPTRRSSDLDLIHDANINFNERVKNRLEKGYQGKRKIRSDAIRLVDGLITSDDIFFKGMSEDETRQFFEDTLEFVKDEYGAENIMYATVHLDEKTPHMHFGFV